ncbi:hypothetical protein [Brevibacillus reuszeri]|uniref:hypothetical protein n=1 Tax=Brevibacillus reuszeri TaxID=54915 RepID=UPI000CCBFB99|nr:hypothetical protein [Brevibacillus reuszeri]
MKKILFIGSYEKTDLMFYTAKLLSIHHKVLIVDGTNSKDYHYTYPKVDTEADIQQHDSFDIAESVNLKRYESLLASDSYDYVLIDINNPELIREWPVCDVYFLVTSHDNTILQKNVQLMSAFFQEKNQSDLVPIYQIVNEGSSFTNEFIRDLFNQNPIDWKETFTFYPDERDLESKFMNQHLPTVVINKLSGALKQTLMGIVGTILDKSAKEMKKVWNQAKRGK